MFWVSALREARQAHHQKTEALKRRRNTSAVRMQRAFRELLARRAALQARRLLLPHKISQRLRAVLARAEARCASLIQERWRVIFHKRKAIVWTNALRLIKRALSRRRLRIEAARRAEARQVALAADEARRDAHEQTQGRGATTLQAHQRRRAAIAQAGQLRREVEEVRARELRERGQAVEDIRQRRASRSIGKAWKAELTRRASARLSEAATDEEEV